MSESLTEKTAMDMETHSRVSHRETVEASDARLSAHAMAQDCEQAMAAGSKSFSLAALLFDRERRWAARYLYRWCRFCDDAVDDARDATEARAKLSELSRSTIEALSPQGTPQSPPFIALRELCTKYDIPALYPTELLNGMRMDAEGYRFRTEDDLRLYCYRVASVVGLMMVHVMGISDPRALRHAVDTGLAMQMTNIARDIADDFKIGRLYIPEEWFLRRRLDVPRLNESFQPSHFTAVTRDLVAEAERLYASGRKGLTYLPFRAALAVAAAQDIYREIGRKVVARGAKAWDARTVVPLWRKLWLLAGAAARVMVMATTRRLKRGRWRAWKIDTVIGPESVSVVASHLH